jgi:hypothetical protein
VFSGLLALPEVRGPGSGSGLRPGRQRLLCQLPLWFYIYIHIYILVDGSLGSEYEQQNADCLHWGGGGGFRPSPGSAVPLLVRPHPAPAGCWLVIATNTWFG